MAPNMLQSYGYHNTFHTHSLPQQSQLPSASPPSYDSATSPHHALRQSSLWSSRAEVPPTYTCDVHFEGFLAAKNELASPFLMSSDNNWHSVYVILHGTQLSLYRVKSRSLFRNRPATAGRLIKTYSLQHAEIGLAADWKAGELVPKSSFARMIPKATQLRIWESDPELFEPIREFVMRLRLESEQILLCADAHESMLDWIERICSGIDVAQPLEDRNEPRFRSLPRRNRRQRQIEASALHNLDALSRDDVGRRLVAQQERLIRRLYPHLASGAISEQTATRTEERREAERETEASQDPDADDLDPADVREDTSDTSPASRPNTARRQESTQSLREASPRREPYDPKTTPPRPDMSAGALLRFRRRCCPILLASSPRASSVIYVNGRRFQIDSKRQSLTLFELSPPRYDPLTAPSPQLPILEFEVEERPRLDRGISQATYASASSSWTSPDGEGAEPEDVSSLHSTAGSGVSSRLHGLLEELERFPSTATDKSQTPKVMGNGKSIFFTLQTVKTGIKVQPAHEPNDEITAALHAPFLV